MIGLRGSRSYSLTLGVPTAVADGYFWHHDVMLNTAVHTQSPQTFPVVLSTSTLYIITMKFLAVLSALAASAAATVIVPRATNPGNASITIFSPTNLQNIGAPGDTFGISIGELNDGHIGFQETQLSLVLGINPCGDDDVCGDNPAGFFGDVLYQGILETSDMFINATIPEGFLDGRASLNLFHAALTQTQNGPLEVFTEIKQVTVVVSPA
ncbi:unnamed protein product [Peniophora sp. CBMAI 1063]|nr:unnamed protein product [Peniophora sp. CBMAI 1063]